MCPCKGCKHSIGGTLHCRQNLEGECRDGGGYEAWEPAVIQAGRDVPKWLYHGCLIAVWAAALVLIWAFIDTALTVC